MSLTESLSRPLRRLLAPLRNATPNVARRDASEACDFASGVQGSAKLMTIGVSSIRTTSLCFSHKAECYRHVFGFWEARALWQGARKRQKARLMSKANEPAGSRQSSTRNSVSVGSIDTCDFQSIKAECPPSCGLVFGVILAFDNLIANTLMLQRYCLCYTQA